MEVRKLIGRSWLAIPLALALLVGSPAGRAVACPNDIQRNEDNSNRLPDCRAYELVSPVAKNGGSIRGPGNQAGGGVFQASPDGNAATFSALASFADATAAANASQYLARRGEGGWSTENITAPTLSGAYGDGEVGVPYQLFSPDLSSGVLLAGRRCRSLGEAACPLASPPLPGTEAPAGYLDYYLRNGDGGYQALVTKGDVSSLDLPPSAFEVDFVGASPSLGSIVISTCAALTTNATEAPLGEGCDPAEQNLYEFSPATGLTLVNLRPTQGQGTPGATLAAQAGAISSDGSRVYWSEGGVLYLREGGTGTAEVAIGGEFQTASADGAIAFYTEGEHLYRFGAVGRTNVDLTPGGGVIGVLGASEDGSSVYYATASGVFLARGGMNFPVAGAADSGDYPPTTGTARVTPDGSHLAFLSKASLTGYPNAGYDEVYLYGAPEGQAPATLTCVSCNPSGLPPIGPSSIPGATVNGSAPGSTAAYKPRVLAADGDRIFFDSVDSLNFKDVNGQNDVYEWEQRGTGDCRQAEGCIGLLSGGQSVEASEFVDATPSGSDAFFVTAASLLPQDPGSYDLYDAREGGGFPQPQAAIECVGDLCQTIPVPPDDPAVGTAGPGSTPNPPVHFPKKHKKHKKKKHDQKGRKGHGKRKKQGKGSKHRNKGGGGHR